jgi:hypothetical protein
VRFQYILCLSFISYVPFVSSFLRVRYTCIYIHFFRSALWTFCMLQVKILPSYSDRLRRIEKAVSRPPFPSECSTTTLLQVATLALVATSFPNLSAGLSTVHLPSCSWKQEGLGIMCGIDCIELLRRYV